MPRKEDSIPATLRAISVLEALVLTERPSGLAELTAAVRLPKPTLYRMLGMLQTAGLVTREPVSRKYCPGPRLATLGRNVMLNATLRAGRRAVLSRLVEQIGETCNFTMLDHAEVVYVDRVEAAWPLRMNLTSGSHVPLHCTASGKLLLAMLPKTVRDRIAAELSLARFTDTTITDRKRLSAELARIRENRYSIDNEEYHAGLVCVAVPVFDNRKRACAALAVHAPVSRMPLERALGHLPTLRQAASAMAGTFS
jgi:IclR family acetate operon transcriptional repressor